MIYSEIMQITMKGLQLILRHLTCWLLCSFNSLSKLSTNKEKYKCNVIDLKQNIADFIEN